MIATTIIIINSTREKYTEILNTCSITKEEIVIALVHTSSVVDYTIPSRSKGKDGLAQRQVNVPG